MKIPTFLLLASTVLATPLWLPPAIAASMNNAKPSPTHDIPIVTNAWARATVPGQPVGAAYMTIESPVSTKLLEAQTDAARIVEVHDMHQHDGVMQMRAHGQLELPQGKQVELAPGGTHFMLLGLNRPLKAGETVQMKLTFAPSENAATRRSIVIDVPVRALGQ